MVYVALQRLSSQPLSRLIATENTRYNSLPPSERLCSHRPFRLNSGGTQACISAKIRRESVKFVWVSLMGLTDDLPDDDNLVRAAVELDVVNNLICTPGFYTASAISTWQTYMFKFGASISLLFHIDVTTKLHRLMRHVDRHLVLLGCLRRGSSEENEMAHKQFKTVYSQTNKRPDTLGQQLLKCWIDTSQHFKQPVIDDHTDTQTHSQSLRNLSNLSVIFYLQTF